MTTKTIAYRFIKLFVLISTLLLILSSCDIIDSIFGSGDDIITVDPGYNLIGTQVIGSTGGEINLDSIIVKVPSGAFDESNEISISVGEENDIFGEYGNSALYEISGLPSTINKSIRISIKYHGTLEGDTLIAIGEMKHSTSLDSSLYSYHTENASDSLGYLVYDIPAYSNLAKPNYIKDINLNNSTKKFMAIFKYKKALSSGNHFILSYPIRWEYQVLVMGELFESAYVKYKSLGYEFHGRTTAANVLVAPFLNHAGEYLYTISNWGINQKVSDQELRNNIKLGEFQINLNILSDESKLRVITGHELLHLIQNTYEFSSPNVEPEQDWLAEATAVWVEEKFSNSNPHVSANSIGKEMYPFDGWQYNDSGRSYAKQGYGLSVIIKGLVDKYSDSAIIKIFEKIKAGILPDNATDPVDAVLSVLTETVGNFWHDVLGSYVLGHYYSSQVNFKFLDDQANYTETVTIGTATDNSSLNYDYHDLSGKLFKVTPGNTNTLTTVPISFTVNDPVNCGILVCKYKQGSEITKIGEVFPGGSGKIVLDDVKPTFDAGYDLVVLVSNSKHNKASNYQGNNTVELIIKIDTPPEDLNSLLISSDQMTIYLDTYCYWESAGDPETSVYLSVQFDGCGGGSGINLNFSEGGKYYSISTHRDDTGNNIFEDCRFDITFNTNRTNIIDIKAYSHRIDLNRDLEYEFTIKELIPIVTTDLNIINDNQFIEYYLETGIGAEFEAWVKEGYYDFCTECWDTYRDTKGDQRYLRVRIKFYLPGYGYS